MSFVGVGVYFLFWGVLWNFGSVIYRIFCYGCLVNLVLVGWGFRVSFRVFFGF